MKSLHRRRKQQQKEFAAFPQFEDDKGVAAPAKLIAHQANKRQGNASTKTRAEVSGTGKKLFRQKAAVLPVRFPPCPTNATVVLPTAPSPATTLRRSTAR